MLIPLLLLRGSCRGQELFEVPAEITDRAFQVFRRPPYTDGLTARLSGRTRAVFPARSANAIAEILEYPEEGHVPGISTHQVDAAFP